jgi:hypothetical protein
MGGLQSSFPVIVRIITGILHELYSFKIHFDGDFICCMLLLIEGALLHPNYKISAKMNLIARGQ